MSVHHPDLRRRVLAGTSLALGAALIITACSGPDQQSIQAEEGFPSRSIDVVVPFAPGGSADGTTRQLVAEAEEACGTSFVIRNETGGAGSVGFRSALDSTPDGYTVGTAAIEMSILEHFGIVDILPERDVQGIIQYSEQPVAIAVPEDSPIESFEDLQTSENDRMTVATSGTGSIYHLGFGGMALAAGLDDRLVNAPFDGTASALQAAMGGQTDAVTAGAAELRPFVESGDLRALAVFGDPVDYFPQEVPTLEELGYDWDSTAVLGIYAPAGTPDEHVEFLSDCLDEARQSESFSEYMETTGLNQVHRDAEEFDAFLDEEYDRYGEVVREIGLVE